MATTLSMLRQLIDGLRTRIGDIKDDRTTSAEEKARLIREAKENFRENYDRERRNVMEGLETRRVAAFRIAHPAEQAPPGEDTQAEILREQRRERVHRELTAEWAGRGSGPTVQEYEAALTGGDELRVEAMEIYGPAAISNEDSRRLFAGKVKEMRAARMPEERRRAFEELEELERTRYEVEVALAFLDKTSRELTSTSAA